MMVENARAQVAALVAVPAADVVFTSGATEAAALAFAGLRPGRILVSAIEHDAVWEEARRQNVPVADLPVTRQGQLDLAALEAALAVPPPENGLPVLVCLMLAHNETGVVQPVSEAAALAHKYGALLLCDAVQAAGRIPVDLAALGVDAALLSGHKLGAPSGVGALILRTNRFDPPHRGGGQEKGARPGTENLSGIAGFGAAAEAARAGLPHMAAMAAWRDAFETRLTREWPGTVIIGADAPRLPTTALAGFPGRAGETLVIGLDLADVAVSAGAACSSGKMKASRSMAAMGRPDLAAAVLRFSLGWSSQPGDLDQAATALIKVLMRSGAPDEAPKQELRA